MVRVGRDELNRTATLSSDPRGEPLTWIVHVGGLVQTGSGAIKDALLDSGCFLTLKGKSFAMSESRLFVGRPTIPSFVARAGRLTGDDVLALWTAGTRLPEDAAIGVATRRFLRRTRRSHGVNRKFLLKVDDVPLRSAAEDTAQAIAAARTRQERSDAYILGTRRAIRALLPLDGRMVLIDNDPAVSTHIRRHLRLDPQSIFVGVMRNLSDQYIDRRNRINHDQTRLRNVVYVIASGLLRRRYFAELIRAAREFPERCLIVEFEPFVSDSDYREAFFASVLAGSEPRDREGPVRFAAEHSVTNIGLELPKGDRLQHAIYTRMLDRAYMKAQQLAGPDAWPTAATSLD